MRLRVFYVTIVVLVISLFIRMRELNSKKQVVSIEYHQLVRIEPEFDMESERVNKSDLGDKLLNDAKQDSIRSGIASKFWYAFRVKNTKSVILVFTRSDITDVYVFYRISNGLIMDKCEVGAWEMHEPNPVFPPLEFPPESHILSADHQKILRVFLDGLDEASMKNLYLIVGQTPLGLPYEPARVLSEQRAQAVRKFLIENGMPSDSLRAEGLGCYASRGRSGYLVTIYSTKSKQ